MQFTKLFAIGSALTIAAAAPAPATTPSSHPAQLFKRKDCPSDFQYFGSCNGTSCRWGLINYRCDIGKCTGSGGGDGSCCGWAPNGAVKCPNGGF